MRFNVLITQKQHYQILEQIQGEKKKTLLILSLVAPAGRAKYDQEVREFRTFREKAAISVPRVGWHQPCGGHLRWAYLQARASQLVEVAVCVF